MFETVRQQSRSFILWPLSILQTQEQFSVSVSDRKNGQIPESAHLLAATGLWVRGIWKWAQNRQIPGHCFPGKREKDRDLYQYGFLRVPVKFLTNNKCKSNFQRKLATNQSLPMFSSEQAWAANRRWIRVLKFWLSKREIACFSTAVTPIATFIFFSGTGKTLEKGWHFCQFS